MELLKYDSLAKLAVAAAKNVSFSFSENEKYTAEQTSELLRAQMNILAHDYRSFRENKNTIFSLIEQTIDEVLPAKVMQQYEQFADVRTVAQGDKVVFVRRITEASRMRAKQFVTQVGLAGRYETFMLDGELLRLRPALLALLLVSALRNSLMAAFSSLTSLTLSLRPWTSISTVRLPRLSLPLLRSFLPPTRQRPLLSIPLLWIDSLPSLTLTLVPLLPFTAHMSLRLP